MTAPVPIGIRHAADAMRSGSLTAVELMMQCLEMADRLGEALNVFAARNDRDQLLVQAAEIDRRRRHGRSLGSARRHSPRLEGHLSLEATFPLPRVRRSSPATGPVRTDLRWRSSGRPAPSSSARRRRMNSPMARRRPTSMPDRPAIPGIRSMCRVDRAAARRSPSPPGCASAQPRATPAGRSATLARSAG